MASPFTDITYEYRMQDLGHCGRKDEKFSIFYETNSASERLMNRRQGFKQYNKESIVSDFIISLFITLLRSQVLLSIGIWLFLCAAHRVRTAPEPFPKAAKVDLDKQVELLNNQRGSKWFWSFHGVITI